MRVRESVGAVVLGAGLVVLGPGCGSSEDTSGAAAGGSANGSGSGASGGTGGATGGNAGDGGAGAGGATGGTGASAGQAGSGGSASLAHFIPGPTEAGFDPALEKKALSYDRQFHVFSAAPFGLSLDAFIPDTTDRGLVSEFLAQEAELDFGKFTTQKGTPKTPLGIVSVFDEHGDLGMFAGVAAVGEAMRYIAFRDGGATAGAVTAARDALVRAIQSFHVAAKITGTPGTVARGIRRLDEPGLAPSVVPVPATCPSPGKRGDTWRSDGSGALSEWMYRDNNSKDQMLGYVMALGAFWDAVGNDPAVPAQIKTDLKNDARDLGLSLMKPVPIALGISADLVIRDWNDCPTKHHDLNPRLVPMSGGDPILLPEGSGLHNGWNALASLGVIRTLYHVSGDEQLRSYYYGELVAKRKYQELMVTGAARVSSMYQNTCAAGKCVVTNFSNVNMAFVAMYGLLRYETDPTLRAAYRSALENELWNTPGPHDGIEVQQAFFNLVYGAFRAGGHDPKLSAAASAQLGGFPAPPYWDPAVENCDAAELAAKSCIATDGTTQITIDPVLDWGGSAVSTTPLPMSLRPSSNFEWRSDPRRLNGGGSERLNPGGDFRVTYWLGRALFAPAYQDDNVSPIARKPDGSGGPS